MNCSYCARAASLAAMLVAQAKLPILLPRWCFFFRSCLARRERKIGEEFTLLGRFCFGLDQTLEGSILAVSKPILQVKLLSN